MARTLTDYPEIVAGFSQAADGTMSLNGKFDNRKQYLRAHGLDPKSVVHAGLCHGVRTAIVTSAAAGQVIDNTDGLITAEANLGLAMTAADCLLISIFDPRQQVIGLVHAGSKGLARDAVAQFIKTWLVAFPAKPADMIIDISPSICPEHYTVSINEAKHFAPWPDACQKRQTLMHLDLRRIAVCQLTASGVKPGSITVSPRCTFENHDLFSYRRDHPPTPQLQVGYLMRQF